MSGSEVSVRFPVVFGAQHDRPRKNVKVVPPADAPPADAPPAIKQRRGRPKAADAPSAEVAPPAATDAPTWRTARSLALATFLRRKIEAGEILDHAHAADLLWITAASANYLLNLTYLAADIQEALLIGNLVVRKRRLRPVARVLGWEEQRRMLQ